MSKSNAVTGIKPNSSLSDNGENIVFLPLSGADGTSRNISAVVRGYPTLITLGGAVTHAAGQYLLVAGAGGITRLNGYHKLLEIRPSNVIALDVDSSDSSLFPAWTSGGTVAGYNVSDAFGNMPTATVLAGTSGVITGIWGTPANGLTFDPGASKGNYLPKSTESVFDVSGTTGRVVFSFDWNGTTPSTGTENLYCHNRDNAVGAGAVNGAIWISSAGSQHIDLNFLPKSADGSTIATATQLSSGQLGSPATGRHIIQFVIDYDTDTIYAYRNNLYVGSAPIVRAVGETNPAMGNGAVFFAGYSSAGTYSYPMGGSGMAPSLRHAMFWRTNKSLSTVQNCLRILARTEEFPAHLL